MSPAFTSRRFWRSQSLYILIAVCDVSFERKKEISRGDGSRTLLMERRKPSQQLGWLPYLGPNAHDIDATIEEASIGLPIAEYKIHASYLLLFVSPA